MLSAGLLLYRISQNNIEVFLVHPGGPFWKNKDDGAWSIPKGEVDEGEDHLTAALREFKEETGKTITGDFIPLHPVKMKSGKTVIAFAVEANLSTEGMASNTIEINWPPKSGKKITIPEVDQWEWMNIEKAAVKINSGLSPLLNELVQHLNR